MQTRPGVEAKLVSISLVWRQKRPSKETVAYIHTYTREHTQTCHAACVIHTCTHMQHTYAHTVAYIHIHTHKHAQTHKRKCAHDTHTRTHAQLHTHTHTRTHAQLHTHTQTERERDGISQEQNSQRYTHEKTLITHGCLHTHIHT